MKDIETFYPLSPMQEGMLYHTLVAPESGVYITQVNFPLEGELDLNRFRQAWQQAVSRHSTLRTFFVWEKVKEPIQVVKRQVTVPWAEHDWRSLAPEVQRERLRADLEDQRRKGFDLSRVPSFQLSVIRLRDTLFHMHWSFHHIILDGWSVQVVLREVSQIYLALGAGQPAELRPARPYRDYISWLYRQDMSSAESFWRAQLKGFRSVTPLAVDRQPEESISQTAGYVTNQRVLTVTLGENLRGLSRRGAVTLNTLVQGAWALLLSRYSGLRDVLFGFAVFGRPAELEGVESMVGLFVNTLAARVQIPRQCRLLPWLRQLQTTAAEARRYEYSPLVEVQGWSEVPRGVPLYESLITFDSHTAAHASAEGSPAASLARRPGAERSVQIGGMGSADQSSVPLTLVVKPALQITLGLRYDQQHFEGTTIHRMLSHLEQLLQGMAAQAEGEVDDLSLLSAVEHQQVLVEWNDTSTDFCLEGSLHGGFQEQARRSPESVALVFGHTHLSFWELERRSNQLARFLRRSGVQPQQLVAIAMERSLELVVGLLGILKAGAAYVPLDPSYPTQRLTFMLQDSGVHHLVGQQHLLNEWSSVSGVELLSLDSVWSKIAAEDASALAETSEPESLAYMIYTSGSTGRPKGVMNRHRAIRNRLLWMQEAYGLIPGDTVLQKTPYSFDVSVWEFFWSLSVGAKMVLARPEGHKDSSYLGHLLEQERITTVHFVPSMLQVFLGTEEGVDLHGLRRVICSGEALPFALQKFFYSRVGAAELHNLYGPTEAAVDVTAWHCPAVPGDRRVPIGRPISNTQIHLLGHRQHPVPVGVAGELHIGGENLARGYFARPGLTAQKFIPDPFCQHGGGRLYRTGDLARPCADGQIEYLGRLDHQIKIRGFRVELDEIRALLIEHDEVRDAVVIAQQLDPQNSRLVGYVVPRRDEVSAAKLRQYLAEKLPDFMVPAIYVSIAEMPLTPSGKLDRRALPDVEDPVAREVAYASPRNPWDLQLVRIWERLLNRQNIGIDDNFFELGGHSILALRLMAQIRSAFDQDLPLATLVENPSIRKLTEILRTGTKLRWSFLVPFQAENSEPSFFCVHPIGGQVLCYMDLVRHFGPEQNFYGLQSPRLEDITAESKGLTIETMAQQYLAEMVEVQPQGPYLLGGWSFGGYVAVEIARELRRRGEEVPLLALLDTWTPEIHRVTQDDAFMLLELVKDRARRRDLEVDLSIEQLRAVADDERLEFVLRWVHRHKLVPQELDLSLLRRLLAGYRIRREALQRFRPQPYPGPITLFRAVEEDPLTLTAIAEVGVDIHDPTYGWQHLTPEIVQIFEVPGYHETMCREPYVETLAKQLRNCIRSSLKRVTKHA